MKFIGLIIAIVTLQFVTACETTGNPNEGGLWGWNEDKAQIRQHNLRSELSSTEGSTARHRSAAERKRQMLNE